MSIFGSIMGAIFGQGSAQASRLTDDSAKRASGTNRRCRSHRRQGRSSNGRKARLAHLHRRPDESTQSRQQPGARKQLAKELNYTGDTNNSAAMNVWLHKQIMAKLAANGGKLPADIKA